jgi:glycosyltransferase involved in cell wall biosynthesis
MSGGGVGSVLTDLCEAMAQKSREIYVISLFRRRDIDFKVEQEWAAEKGINVLMMQDNESDSVWKVLYNLRRTLKRLTEDDECCVFMHLKWGVLAGVICSLGLKNVGRVEVYHSGYLNYRFQAFICKPFIHHYISVSKEAKQQLIDWFHIKEQKIDVVYNGVDVDLIREKAQAEKKNKNLIRFVSVGRLSFEKGFKTPIAAYAELKDSGQLSETSYTMIGKGVQRDECEALSKGYVTFTGVIPREEVYRNIGLSDVMILPSLWEGNSILMLEVLSLGKPMILTDIPSFREVMGFEALNDNESCRLEWFGAVFRKEDVEACKQAMQLVYNKKSTLTSVANKIKSLGDRFSTKEQAKEYMRVASENRII